MSNLDRVLFTAAISVVTCLIVLPLGYLWTRSMHYPFTLLQRKMWTFYVLIVAGTAVLCPLFVAMVRIWSVSLNRSVLLVMFLLVSWTVVAFCIAHRISKHGDA